MPPTSDIAVEEYAPSQMELRERGLILIGPDRRRPRVRDGRYRSHARKAIMLHPRSGR